MLFSYNVQGMFHDLNTMKYLEACEWCLVNVMFSCSKCLQCVDGLLKYVLILSHTSSNIIFHHIKHCTNVEDMDVFGIVWYFCHHHHHDT